MRKIYLLLIFVAFTLTGFTQEVLLNGTFESWDDANTPTSWTHVEGVTQESTIVHSGTYSAKQVGGTNDLGQTISGIEPGKQYTLTIWYKVEAADGTDARIWSYWKNGSTSLSDNADELRGPNNSYLDNNGGVWTKYTTTVTAPATADNFYFEVRTYSGATVYWDDFSFVKDSGSDSQAPTWTTGYPEIVKVEDTRGILVVNLDEACTAYYIVVPGGSTAPTSAEVKAGTDYGSVTVNVKGDITVTSANTSYNDTITGATAETSYDIWVVAEDGSGNLQSSPTKVPVTTTAARSLSLTYPGGGDIFSVGETIPVQWTSANLDSLFIVVYNRDQDTVYVINNHALAAATGQYDLKVPGEAALGDYDFFVVDAYDTSFYDKVGPVTLVDDRRLSFIEPQANQTVYVGDTIFFKWNASYVDSVLIGGYNAQYGDHFMLTGDLDHYDEAYWKPIPATQDTFSFYLDPKNVSGNQTITLYLYDASDTSFKATVTPINIVDTLPMTVTYTSPTFDMTDFPPMGAITCVFNIDIKAGTGALHLKKSDGTTVQDVDVSELHIDGNSLSFSPNLIAGESYYIEMDAGLVKSSDDSKSYSGLSGKDWSFTVASNELYFSEYDEGSGNNKALEIYNPTDHDINLDNYVIGSSYNGSGIQSDLYHFPSGHVLGSGDVFVLANASAGSDILAVADDTLAYNEGGYVTSFNGNDARALIRIVSSDSIWVTVDLIGVPDVDPGTAWDVAGVTEATLNHTLLRKINVPYGDLNWSSFAGTDANNSQWVVEAEDYFDNLGLPSPTATGINDPELARQLELYPNPNNGIFKLNTNGIFKDDFNVRIIDVTGRLVYQKVFSGTSTISVDISQMSNSIYFITLHDAKHTIVKKFIKK